MYFSSMTQIVRFRVYLPETLEIFLEDTRHNEWQRLYKRVLSFRWIPLTVNWLPNFPLSFLPVAGCPIFRCPFFLSGCPNFHCPFYRLPIFPWPKFPLPFFSLPILPFTVDRYQWPVVVTRCSCLTCHHTSGSVAANSTVLLCCRRKRRQTTNSMKLMLYVTYLLTYIWLHSAWLISVSYKMSQKCNLIAKFQLKWRHT